MLRLLKSLAVGALLVGVVAAPTSAASSAPEDADASGTTWALEPADGRTADGRVSLRHTIEEGGSVSDSVVLTNFSPHDATFAIYASDGVVDDTGNFDLLQPDVEPVDGGSWVRIGDVEGATERPGGGIEVAAPASSSVVIPLSIDVPAGATPGDHPAGVVAELVQGGDSDVRMTSRVGVRLHLRVPGEIVAQVTAEDVTATYSPSWNPLAPGTVTIDYSLANTGNIRVGADVTVSVGPVGGEVASALREVLPGQAAAATTEVRVWPLFRATGEIVATPTVVGEDEVPGALLPTAVPFTVWTVPWPQLLVLALLVGAVVLVVRARRRSAARIQARIDAAVAAATAAASGESDTDETDARATEAGEPDAPGTGVGEPDAPGTDVSEPDARATEAGEADAPGTDVGEPDAPGTGVGATGAIEADARGADAGATDAVAEGRTDRSVDARSRDR